MNDKPTTTFAKVKNVLSPLTRALDSFLREPLINTKTAPFIRDAVDLKRWMMLVVFALFPCIFMAIWNTGVQAYVYGSFNRELVKDYLEASQSFSSYLSFTLSSKHFFSIVWLGLKAFIPIMFICYFVGGFWEVLFACIKGHEVSEGFLVTGMLIALILPPTIPYWMVAVGVSFGVVIGKELFGGTGMNILNPALTARCFLFFTYPTKMTGTVWVGLNQATMNASLLKINANAAEIDTYSTSSFLNIVNASSDVKKVHVDTLGHFFGKKISNLSLIKDRFSTWTSQLNFDNLSLADIKAFLTAPLESGGLGLSPESFLSAYHLAKLKFSEGMMSDGNLFFGNMIGSMGETSKFCILFGLVVLLVTQIASWRTALAMAIGGFGCALAFEYGAIFLGADGGAWTPAKFSLPAYKHLLMGSFAFGLVYMATEPVTSPNQRLGKWIYGMLIGVVTIVIRLINPAFPEGVMLAILFGNVLSPLIDHYSLKYYRKKRRDQAKKILFE